MRLTLFLPDFIAEYARLVVLIAYLPLQWQKCHLTQVLLGVTQQQVTIYLRSPNCSDREKQLDFCFCSSQSRKNRRWAFNVIVETQMQIANLKDEESGRNFRRSGNCNRSGIRIRTRWVRISICKCTGKRISHPFLHNGRTEVCRTSPRVQLPLRREKIRTIFMQQKSDRSLTANTTPFPCSLGQRRYFSSEIYKGVEVVLSTWKYLVADTNCRQASHRKATFDDTHCLLQKRWYPGEVGYPGGVGAL